MTILNMTEEVNITKTCTYNKQGFFEVLKLKFSAENFGYLSYFCSKHRLYTLGPPRRGGSNKYSQPMFWSKNKKIGMPLHIPVLLYKSGVQGGIHYTDMFS